MLAAQSVALGLAACSSVVVAAGLAAPAASPADSAPGRSIGEARDGDGGEILVTSALKRGSVRTEIPVEFRVERATIRALGADSLSEVVDAFEAQAQSLRGDDGPILLLNGRRIGSRGEIDELPPEAILRFEIFPEEVALQYGHAPDRRVINVILRPRYRATEPSFRANIPLGRGRASYRAGANFVDINSAGRASLDLGYRRQEPLADRKSGDGADRRWRLPRTDRLSANGSYAREFGNLTLTANANGRWQRGRWKLGRGANDLGLRRRETQTRGRFGVTLGGDAGRWLWSASGALQLQKDRIVTRDTDGALAPVGYSMRATRREAQLDLIASGPLGQLSAGSVLASLGGGFALRRHEARDPLPLGTRSVVRQDSAHVSGSVAIPLLRDDGAVAFGEGRLIAARRDGTLGRYGFGLRGSPLAGLSYSASYSHERSLPDFFELAGTQLLTPNVRVYDFVSGTTRYVDRLEGGNPDLRPPTARRLSLHLRYRPPAMRDLSVSLDYTDLALRHGVSGPLGPTPQVEAAFPGRFERDLSGRLMHFDRRPLNVAREDRRQIRWGIDWARTLGPPPVAAPGGGKGATASAGGRLQLALYHRWLLEDVAVLRAGTPRIDLLDGAAIGDRGGASRHRLEGQLGYAGRRFGVRLAGNWDSPSRVREARPGGHRLTFRHGLRLDLRAYLKLDEIGDALGVPWIGGRLNLAVDNLFGGRTRIRDRNGKSVTYYRGIGEDTGRAIRMSFRQIFD